MFLTFLAYLCLFYVTWSIFSKSRSPIIPSNWSINDLIVYHTHCLKYYTKLKEKNEQETEQNMEQEVKQESKTNTTDQSAEREKSIVAEQDTEQESKTNTTEQNVEQEKTTMSKKENIEQEMEREKSTAIAEIVQPAENKIQMDQNKEVEEWNDIDIREKELDSDKTIKDKNE